MIFLPQYAPEYVSIEYISVSRDLVMTCLFCLRADKWIVDFISKYMFVKFSDIVEALIKIGSVVFFSCFVFLK